MESLKKILCFALFLTTLIVNRSTAAEQFIELSLVVPESKVISLTSDIKHSAFQIIFRNVSQQPQKLAAWICSQRGHLLPQGLYFELELDGQKLHIGEISINECDKSYPKFWLIPPNEELVFDISFNNQEWENLPNIKAGESKKAKLKAIFKSERQFQDYCTPGSLFEELCIQHKDVWEGQIESAYEEVILQN